MLIISTFEHTLQLEQALAILEKSGIDQKSMLVVPMDLYEKSPNQRIIRAEDTRARGFEVGMAVATGFSVVGASVGFRLEWGPIVWGLAYALIGFAIGFGAVILLRIRRGERAITRSPRRPLPEIAVIIQCCETKADEVRHVLWQYRAISVGDAAEPAK